MILELENSRITRPNKLCWSTLEATISCLGLFSDIEFVNELDRLDTSNLQKDARMGMKSTLWKRCEREGKRKVLIGVYEPENQRRSCYTGAGYSDPYLLRSMQNRVYTQYVAEISSGVVSGWSSKQCKYLDFKHLCNAI